MVILKRIFIGILLIGFAYLAYKVIFPNEKTRINKQLFKLSNLMSKDSNDSIIGLAQNSGQFANLFSNPCKVSVREINLDGDYDNKVIKNYYMALRSKVEKLNVKFMDVKMEILNQSRAHIDLTLKAKGKSKGQDTFSHVEEMFIEFNKNEGIWKISKIRSVEILIK
ncbi:MAG: hypothetical protein ABIA04_04975 [Pseudomonadota bacterium]